MMPLRLILTVIMMLAAAPVVAEKVFANDTGHKQCGAKFPATNKLSRAFEAWATNRCYSCPRGFEWNVVRGVKGKKTCVKRVKGPNKYSVVKYRGKEGCVGLRNFEFVPTGKCYQCPTGAKRNNFIADPAKKPVCKVDKPKIPAWIATRYEKAKPGLGVDFDFMTNTLDQDNSVNSYSDLRSSLEMGGNPPQLGNAISQFPLDRERISYMKAMLNGFPKHNAENDKNYQTVSFAQGSGAAAVIGYQEQFGYSMMRLEDNSLRCDRFETKIWSVGMQSGGDIGQSFEIHQYPIEDVGGRSSGLANAGLAWDTYIGWTSDGDPSLGLAGPILMGDGAPKFWPSWLSMEGVSAAYARTKTEILATHIPCDILTWGADFDRVFSDSWVKE